jgi:hypothetical protein
MADQEQEVIELVDGGGISRRFGTDAQGTTWVEWVMDAFACEEPGECAICGRGDLEHTFTCLDGGEEVCPEHIVWKEGQ